MAFKPLDDGIAVSPQITLDDVAEAARQGYRSIISNRPDEEEAGQLTADAIRAEAERHGLTFTHIPIAPGKATPIDSAAMAQALETLPKPILAFCRSGMRSATLWALSKAGQGSADRLIDKAAAAGYDLAALAPRLRAPSPSASFDVVIVGGGSAGIATAASILKRNARLTIAIVDPAQDHYYQPGWTLVGAGVFRAQDTRRAEADVMPKGVTWLQVAATGFDPDRHAVALADGRMLTYRVLVAAPGLRLAWEAIAGLEDTLGRNGVTSNYLYDLAPYTHRLVQEMTSGRALFSQPPMPIKCAGAPQKAMYLSCDIWRRAGLLPGIDVEFHNAGAVLFGVSTYVPALMDYIARYGIDLRLESNLVAVDGARRVATFECKRDGRTETIERAFDMLHVVPPHVSHDWVAKSPLAAPSGFIDVDEATLRHKRYDDVFALGDGAGTSNAKTAAAARQQAPVVAVNVLAALEGKPPAADYDGYGSCPLTVERGKIVLAEFGYGGKLLPTFPKWLVDGARPTRAAWFLKERMLPPLYWQGMLKGRELLARPHRIGAAS
ncbi:oxidoreductase (flavoprotein) [Sphingomonas sp. S17]|jgi:sulfide:quinone oxidoreductase|uniref:TIGR01244 family phosphatase n=2 Tax=Sphingomonas paucimobilis TaxID=13689 RepID=A0A411LEG0_SPHPI|nr:MULTISPECIES: bifunctional protein tyrosine phosphatase family protein/NAD(P)/FAD-dependent oxidoreductase [Pseudomonadota]EGI55374.1 oxidoreductase (flavoprotein) [Sphingomonas sp. S17]MBQ1478712.1 TIGR01244 family phosphatase [Sphingomonas sp.]MCM3680730.1 bifunctional protein tyrosine phosphatase family protein/NAD(P)/FAD-dependent oxidoreductase [Sphingomonas paucimobilis]MDG5971231.1 TIGR01244 family phosphatase [Sphingomonas paucimobilis]NDO84006.1 TIGR01244 family protein [Citrobacte